MEKAKFIHILYSGFGGTNDYVFNLIQGDEKEKYQHEIIFFGIEEVPDENLIRAQNICHRVSMIIKSPGYDKSAIEELRKLINTENTAAISLHVNSLIQPLSKIISKDTCLIYVEHQANHLKSKKEWLWSILAQKKADKVICLSPEYQAELKRKLKFLYRIKKNTVIRTGIELKEIANPQDEIIKIGMISRINDFRDHVTLLSAFSGIHKDKIELHIAGDGPNLKSLIARFPQENIKFHGLLNSNEIDSLLNSFSIYVHASFGETSSIAIMQAQAKGLAIIASDVSGINNVLNKENAILVELENIEAMKSALTNLIDNQKLRIELANKSKDYALENLDRVKMFESFNTLIL